MPPLTALQLLLATFAGWVHRQQAQVIDYLLEENRVLKEQLGKKRLRLTDDQRRRLAAPMLCGTIAPCDCSSVNEELEMHAWAQGYRQRVRELGPEPGNDK